MNWSGGSATRRGGVILRENTNGQVPRSLKKTTPNLDQIGLLVKENEYVNGWVTNEYDRGIGEQERRTDGHKGSIIRFLSAYMLICKNI